MRKVVAIALGIVLLHVLLPVEIYSSTDQVAGLQVRHQNGQTFITWKEIEPVPSSNTLTFGELQKLRETLESKQIRYRIYRARNRITSVKGLAPVREVMPLAAWNTDFYGVYIKPEHVVETYVIEDGQQRLPAGTGLFVLNPTEAGESYYAVTVVIKGQESAAIGEDNSLKTSIKETVGQGVPVLQRTDKPKIFWFIEGATRNFYVRWEVPPNSSIAGKPFDYLVAIPPNLPRPAQVGLNLHLWGGGITEGYGWWLNGESGSIWVSANEVPYDWWTGYHERIWTDKPLKTPQDWKQGVVRPYTQRRLLSFLEWVGTKWQIDPTRTFVAGVSMGGSGSLMLAIRFPQHFAWVHSWVGVHVPKETYFKSSYAAMYGEPEWGVKYEDGTPVWDYYDDVWYLRQHPEAQIGFLSFANGKNDAGVNWPQAVKFLRALQETRQPHMFNWGQDGHGQRAGMPGYWTHDLARQNRHMPIDIRVDQTLPAFTNSSLDNNPGNGDPADGDPAGTVNFFLYWETKDIVDEPQRWAMTVGVGDPAPTDTATVDVTPRRCQKFSPKSGEKFRWTNSTGGLLGKTSQSGEVVADRWGLVTLEKVIIGKGKNRLTISK